MPAIEFTSPPRRVLIVKPSAIGDVVHTFPALARLRKLWPAAEISWLISPGCAALVRNHPMIDRVIVFDAKLLSRAWKGPAAFARLRGFIREIQERRFDLVIDFQGLLRSALVTMGTRSPMRVGFANSREGSRFFYTHRVACSWEEDHAVERYLKIAGALGCPDGPVEFPLAVDEEDRQAIEKLIPRDIPFAMMLPGTIWPTKRWPVDKFAGLVQPLRDRFGLETVVSGGPADAELNRRVPARFDLTGKTTLRQTIALIERADLVIANDTGPMHIAAALGRPLVAPYGPTSPLRTGPFGRQDSVIRINLPCSPCYSRTCTHHSCMKWLEIEPVLRLAKEQIAKYGDTPPRKPGQL
jgi:lipopolysaccharide heptosyltransferase I